MFSLVPQRPKDPASELNNHRRRISLRLCMLGTRGNALASSLSCFIILPNFGLVAVCDSRRLSARRRVLPVGWLCKRLSNVSHSLLQSLDPSFLCLRPFMDQAVREGRLPFVEVPAKHWVGSRHSFVCRSTWRKGCAVASSCSCQLLS